MGVLHCLKYQQDPLSETMPKATIEAGLMMKVIKPSQMQCVNLGATVQTEARRFPADPAFRAVPENGWGKRHANRALKLRKFGIGLDGSWGCKKGVRRRPAKIKRAQACTRKLRTNRGRVIRKIRRQAPVLEGELGAFLGTAKGTHAQERQGKSKVNSVNAPEVARISRGKAGKP